MQNAPPITPTSMRCAQCGYDLSGAAIGGVCAECGLSVAETIRRQTQGLRSSGVATTCMVLGILSIAVCMPLGPVAIIWYFRAMKEIGQGGYNDGSRSMAKAGLIMGIIGTAIIALYAVIVLLGLAL